MNNRECGAAGEEIARKYLEKQKIKVIESNYHASRSAEIDIVAKDKDVYAFVEVKMRTGLKNGYGREAVTKSKQKNIRYAAAHYLMTRRLGEVNCRFDVIEITAIGGEINIEYFKNCF